MDFHSKKYLNTKFEYTFKWVFIRKNILTQHLNTFSNKKFEFEFSLIACVLNYIYSPSINCSDICNEPLRTIETDNSHAVVTLESKFNKGASYRSHLCLVFPVERNIFQLYSDLFLHNIFNE